jgi:hypothetical protein
MSIKSTPFLVLSLFVLVTGCGKSTSGFTLPSSLSTAPTTTTVSPTPAPVQATYSSVVLSDSPVGYWQLNETSGVSLADSSPSSANGSVMGSLTLGNTSGGAGAPSSAAADFNGSSAVIIPSSSPVSQLNNGVATVEAWINTTNTDSNYYLVFSEWEADDWNGNQVFLAGGYPNLWSGPNFNTMTGSHSVADGHWHQIVGVWNGNTTSLYIDGVLDQTGSMPFQASYAQSQIGAQCWGEGSTRCDGFFLGEIQNVSVYSRALSASDVSRHFNAGI